MVSLRSAQSVISDLVGQFAYLCFLLLSYNSQQVPLEKKMGSISDKDLRNNEHVYIRPSHIYQEIPATQEVRSNS